MEYPIARVLPLLSPAHLDRDFDYLVPPELDELAQPGVRVRVRFAGRLVDGYLLERRARSDHSGKLVKLERVVSAERVLTPEIRQLTTAVAARYAGTRADVLRLAIPPRHARTETGGKKKSATAQELSADDDETTDDPNREENGGTARTSPPAPPQRVPAAPADAETASPADPETGGTGKNSAAALSSPESGSSTDPASPSGVVPQQIPPPEFSHADAELLGSPSVVAARAAGSGAAGSAGADSTGPQQVSPAPSEGAAAGSAAEGGTEEASDNTEGVRSDAVVPPDPSAADGAAPTSAIVSVADPAPSEMGAAGEATQQVSPAARDSAAPQRVSPRMFSHADAASPGMSDHAAELPDSTDAARTDVDSSPRSPGEGEQVGSETGALTGGPSVASGGSGGGVAQEDSTADVAEASPGVQVPDAWHRYVHGPAFVTALAQGKGPRAAWQALPGEDWPRRLAELAATVAGAGRSAILMVPDQRDLDRVLAECERLLGDSAVGLSAGLGPAARYRRWLSVLRGTARVVVGTRSAVFAPADNLGLIAIWDDGDDTYAEPRAPYPHAREVAMLRSHETGAAFVAAGFARTAEIQAVVETGWAHDLVADRAVVRKASPRISVPGDSDAALERDPVARAVRIPAVAFAAARSALKEGAGVLVQVPRRGYVPALACAKCRTPARCRHCNGPLALPDGRAGQRHSPEPAHSPSCRWCGITEAAFRCQACGSRALRAVVIGAIRTAEELGRAFPGVPIRGSSGGAMLDTVEPGPQVVVATVGAEPVLPGGYGVALLLDSWALLGRADLRAAEDALRRWMTAATLVRSHGQVFVVAEPSIPTVQTLLRWDPVGHARAELASRAEVGFPPAVRMAAIDGTSDSIAELLSTATLPDDVVVLGPVPLPPAARKPFSSGDSPAEVERILLRVDRRSGAALARALTAAQAVRSTHRSDAPLRVQIDPVDIG
ncbi:primosome assembly protein PriA [Nocardia brasiliensis NBRC 14402]|uniref:primosomal protein N' n=1 Tax=Nocardia brasiliensis TaxID=37326 RepID=UPI00045D3A4C|nr:primosomal protein N' [Nocardia brasiliensis]GAJ83397.1 primosome assembly protein PriA [Nocardia brasiliensis NBRC 14402]SUB48404.1 Primosomal protein N' [Nocardia brasiliensis]